MSKFEPNRRYHATYNGNGEFYTGIRHGERVLIDTRNCIEWSVMVQSLEHRGAWLGIYSHQYDLLTDIVEVAQ